LIAHSIASAPELVKNTVSAKQLSTIRFASALALRRAVEVAHVHQRRRLILDRLRQVRMTVAKRVDRDPGRESR
jgi:hypothetical protein